MAADMRPVEMEALCAHLAGSYQAAISGRGGSERDRLFNLRSRALLAFALAFALVFASACAAGASAGQAVAAMALHLLFVKTDLRRGDALALTVAQTERVSRALDRMAQLLVAEAQAQPWGKQAAALFQNPNDGATLKAAMMRSLAADVL